MPSCDAGDYAAIRRARLNRFVGLASLSLVMTAFAAMAQDFDKGLAAYRAGNFTEALREWTPLAEQGNADAQFNLAFLYRNGQGVPRDNAEAGRWFRLAAEQGDADAQYNLAFIYDTGAGVAQDEAAAVRWYRLAAEQGHAAAQYNLGVKYQNGQGVLQNDAEAVRWYRLAAEQGTAVAQFNLAVAYYNGEGVARDFVAAHMWFNIAAANGDDDAVSKRNFIAKSMAPPDFAEAQRRAEVCIASNYQNCD